MKEFDELARADAANMRAARAAAMSRTVYGRFLIRRGEAAAAVEPLRSAELSLSRLAEADRANAGFALDLAYTQSQVAAAYERLAGDAVSGRSAALQRIGCDWYLRSADLFDRLRAQKLIAPEDEPDAEEAAAGVRRCRG